MFKILSLSTLFTETVHNFHTFKHGTIYCVESLCFSMLLCLSMQVTPSGKNYLWHDYVSTTFLSVVITMLRFITIIRFMTIAYYRKWKWGSYCNFAWIWSPVIWRRSEENTLCSPRGHSPIRGVDPVPHRSVQGCEIILCPSYADRQYLR